jgi:TP901 family phage tail tape measure protein
MARTVAVNLAITGVPAVVTGFESVSAASKATAAQLEKGAAGAQKLGSAMVGMGALAAGGMALAVKAAMDWDTEWTQVAKHTTGTTAQLDALQSSLRNMAKEIPSSAKDIAAVAQSVAELGVAAPNVAEFTRVMIELGDTTNLTATDAATSLAKFMNVMGTSTTDVGRLGSTIVALADSSASTGSDIVSMALKIAGVAKSIGMTEAQTLSLSSALASLGSAGGLQVAQAMQKMDAAVRAGGDGLDALAATSGMTSAEFTQAWGTDAAGATAAFVQGLGKIEAAGGSVDDVLSRLKISAGRQSDGLRRLAADSDLLSTSLTTGENAWSSNTALVTEATKQYDTAESRITIAWNRINDAAITAGSKILPMVAELADGAGKAGDALGALPGPVLSLITSLGAGVAVIGLAGGGLLKLAVSGVQARQAFTDMSVAFPRATSAMTAVGKAAGVAALAIAAFAAANAAVKATGIQNTYGGLDDAAGAMAKLSGNADLAGSGIDQFFKQANAGMRAFGITDLVDGVNNIQTAFDRLTHPSAINQVNDWVESVMSGLTGAKTAVSVVTDQFGKLDQGLTAMASGGGADQAAAAFTKVASAAKDASPQQLIDLFPEYSAQVRAAGVAAGYTFGTSEELAGAMQGELPAGMTATQKAAFTMKAATDAAAFSMDDLVKSMFDVGSAALKTSGTQIGYQTAVLDTAKAIKENGKTLDLNTEKGLANRTALDQQAQATLAYVQQLTSTNAETSVVVGAMQRGRDSFIANRIAMGDTAAGAAALADAYGLVPGDVKTTITAPGASEARQSVEDLRASIVHLPPVTQAFIQSVLNTQGIDAAYAAMKALQGTQATVFIKTSYIAANKPILQADGGILKSYAQGGMENHVAQIAPAGAWRVWAEPETGGESYIPLAQEKWPRSREIWWETGKHLGMVAHADGALYSGATTTSVPNVTVGSPMANVQVLLDGRELRHEMRVTYSQESATLATAQRRNRK